MESKKKKLRKNQERREENYDIDRLSCLPDSILTHMLSFLDTKSVIRTSVLSKRYKSLWTLSPCLDFKLSDYRFKRYYRYDAQGKDCSVVSFQSYVKRVLQLREHSNLVMFHLSLHVFVCMDFVQNCLDYAAEHKVQHLRIRCYIKEKSLTLPKLLINSSSLITLHLHNATVNCIELPKSVGLPNLKVLSLKNFEFSDWNFNREMFLGCPNLETLILSKCCIKALNKLKILDLNCLNLKNLEIKYWRSPWKCFDEHAISVNAPKLAVFKFRGHLVKVNFKEGLSFLEEARIDLSYPTACSMISVSERKLRISESLLSILHHICSVRFLALSLKTIEVACAVPDLQARPPIIFDNLRVLRFTTENKYREETVRIETVANLLEKIATDVLIFGDSKEKKVFLESSKSRAKKDGRHISIPAHVLRFLLEGSPAVEFLTIEIPSLSSDEE